MGKNIMWQVGTTAFGLKQILRRSINWLGFDLSRLHQSPSHTLLGLSQLNFRTVIDVGANKGQFARRISKFFPNAEIYCFEPLSEPYRVLFDWSKSRKNHVHCFQLALGDKEGEVTMHLHENHTPSSSLLEATETCHQIYPKTKAERLVHIQVSTLDKMLRAPLDKMPKEILLKLDVQGFEDRVLRGGKHTLSKCRAVILEVSLDPLYEGQANFHDLVGELYNYGFHYSGNLQQSYAPDGRVIFFDAVFIK